MHSAWPQLFDILMNNVSNFGSREEECDVLILLSILSVAVQLVQFVSSQLQGLATGSGAREPDRARGLDCRTITVRLLCTIRPDDGLTVDSSDDYPSRCSTAFR